MALCPSGIASGAQRRPSIISNCPSSPGLVLPALSHSLLFHQTVRLSPPPTRSSQAVGWMIPLRKSLDMDPPSAPVSLPQFKPSCFLTGTPTQDHLFMRPCGLFPPAPAPAGALFLEICPDFSPAAFPPKKQSQCPLSVALSP